MKITLILIMALFPIGLFAQDELLGMLDTIATPKTEYASATFKTTRVVTGHSIESMKAGQLEFRISHRFGKMNTGFDQLWGLDQSIIFLALEYGVTDWLELGYGRTPMEKIYNGFVKVGLLHQSSGQKTMPVSLSYVGSMGISSLPWSDQTRTNYFTSRMHYVNQLLIARKFSDAFSLQLTPVMLHRNLVATALDNNDSYALGIGGRYKFTNRISINAEYFYVFRPAVNVQPNYRNPISVGFDIETGGHVFQIMVSNSQGMIEKHYIFENDGDFSKGDIHLGFNISRVFTIFGDN